ncbi:TPA: BspA family leucine-rich repeat surface protein [Enterococcus faecium]
MLKRKYMLVGLSTITILNLLSFHTENNQAEELLSTYDSSIENQTVSSTSSEENSTIDSLINADSSTKKSETEQSTQNSKTDTITVQKMTDENKDTTKNNQSANFNLSDWQYTEAADTITLNKYIGTSSEITIPGELNNKQVIIYSIQSIKLPTNMTNLAFQAKNNRQVIINYPDMSAVFQNNNQINSIDFSGLNMDNITSMLNAFYNCTNLSSISFGNNTLPKLTSLVSTFSNCVKLKQIDMSQLNLDNVNSMNRTFYGCYTLENVAFGTNKLPKVTSLASTFYNCSQLQSISGQFTLDSVNNLNGTFLNCSSLENVDVSKWNVSKVAYFNDLFSDCFSLHELDLSNWNINSSADISGMFYSTQHYSLFLLTNDERLLNYDYVDAWIDPYGPTLKGNGGTFNNKASSLSFLGSPAIRPSDPRIQDNTFKNELSNFMNENIPNRTDYAFTQWTVSGTSLENAQTIKDLFNTTYTAQWISSKYSTSVDNTVLTPSANLDFAYIPTRFTTAATPINNSGNQEIPLLKTETFNIGIKDRTRTNKSWSVTAQLTWDNPQLKDTYIQTYNPGGATNQNISTGSAPYDPSKDLVVNQDGVNGIPDVKISTSAPIPIMESNSQTNKNAVYDYGLGEAKLVIPETQNIQVGSYTGNVEWNLISAP